jgi:hypothetical protein
VGVVLVRVRRAALVIVARVRAAAFLHHV